MKKKIGERERENIMAEVEAGRNRAAAITIIAR